MVGEEARGIPGVVAGGLGVVLVCLPVAVQPARRAGEGEFVRGDGGALGGGDYPRLQLQAAWPASSIALPPSALQSGVFVSASPHREGAP